MKTEMTISRFCLILIAVTLSIMAGCVNKPAVVYDQPEVAPSGYYEKAWIDPQIILSDSLYTLIRADRIDSFYVAEPPDPEEEMAYAISFQVRQENCFTSVNLLDDRSRIIQPLVAQNLPRGFYKVTCNVSRISSELSANGVYFLKAEYCGFPVVERVIIR